MSAEYQDVYSELVVDHNNVKDLYHKYKFATNKDERATLVNTSEWQTLGGNAPSSY